MSTPCPILGKGEKEGLSKLLRDAIDANKIPATFIGVTTAQETLFSDCAGDIVCGVPGSGLVDPDTTVQLFSATKFVTTVACLQLVDQGRVSLDDPEYINRYLPELAELKILKGYTPEGEAITVDQNPKGAITLRMLLSHTSGLSYGWQNDVGRWLTEAGKRPLGFLAADASIDDYIYPLVTQPGTDYNYGIGLDWAAFLLERVTGENISDYYRKHIFEPCDMRSTGFLPTAAIKDKLMRMTYYKDDHTPAAYNNSFTDGLLPRPEDPDTMGTVFSGGGGLFSTAKDYLAFLRGVLASCFRLRAEDSAIHPLLSDASFQELFTNVLTPKGKKSLVEAMKLQTYHAPELLQDASGRDVGHSVGLCLNHKDSSVGRKAGSGCWDGAAKTQYWLDPETGIAAVCFSNIFAPNPCPFMQFYNEYETALYQALTRG
ncbi:hypothetical protein NliqN6_2738 [Naganishia liquefaciens]|uniref:Beta-lactamase-related domain-containing protein n=1 Tax=Naganishia liquefaciens TaxID=104408 RepID=A0A8H3YG32_9TREE|nr:hypothetical protein NliqN6_2738 [Naganishia liquefaciens]